MAVARMGIVGSGIMGSGIAEVAAKAGVEVVLRSRKQETADAMLVGLGKSLGRQVDKGRLEASVADEVRGRVTATSDLEALADCDLVLESVVEDLAVKKALFVELDGIVKDRAGFVVNALLFPYLNNAVRMLESGIADREGIDTAMQGGCNFPMGPLALLDLVGLDTSVAILDALYDEFRDPNYAPVPVLRRMVAAGHLGRKSGKGFYDYTTR